MNRSCRPGHRHEPRSVPAYTSLASSSTTSSSTTSRTGRLANAEILGDNERVLDQNLRTADCRAFILLLELELAHFLVAASSTPTKQLILPEMDSFHRFLVHQVCDRFNLRSSSLGWGQYKPVQITMSRQSAVPLISHFDLFVRAADRQQVVAELHALLHGDGGGETARSPRKRGRSASGTFSGTRAECESLLPSSSSSEEPISLPECDVEIDPESLFHPRFHWTDLLTKLGVKSHGTDQSAASGRWERKGEAAFAEDRGPRWASRRKPSQSARQSESGDTADTDMPSGSVTTKHILLVRVTEAESDTKHTGTERSRKRTEAESAKGTEAKADNQSSNSQVASPKRQRTEGGSIEAMEVETEAGRRPDDVTALLNEQFGSEFRADMFRKIDRTSGFWLLPSVDKALSLSRTPHPALSLTLLSEAGNAAKPGGFYMPERRPVMSMAAGSRLILNTLRHALPGRGRGASRQPVNTAGAGTSSGRGATM